MKMLTVISFAVVLRGLGLLAATQEGTIEIDASQALHKVSPYLTGACLEDVNHEVYGGIYSQMIFGESFQEPAPVVPVAGFKAYGGNWQLRDDALWVGAESGPKVVYDPVSFASGEASVDLKFTNSGSGNAGFILKVSRPGIGADAFTGYEIAVSPSGHLVLGKHRGNFESLKQVPCAVPLNQWITLKVAMRGNVMQVFVNGASILEYTDNRDPITDGKVGLRNWNLDANFRNLQITTNGVTQNIAFRKGDNLSGSGISGMWSAVHSGNAKGQFLCETSNPFVGTQCQRINFTEGSGTIGIENRGLNRWGMYYVGNKSYEGCVYVRAEKPASLSVALENGDGSTVLASQDFQVTSNNWQRLDFTLTPSKTAVGGRFSVNLKQPDSVVVGYAFLQPGEWGRYKNLPVRKDVVQGLIDQKLTIIRYGGSMVNMDTYRWKNMVGPRAQRPPYKGNWYPYSTDGWGIFDFLNLCDAMGVVGIPDINVGETAQDMIDFVQYVNGPTNTVWGARRAADGHPQPYHLKYIEMGNEERVDEKYFEKFQSLATAIWAQDPNIILIVGDFGYKDPINDPFNFTGADSGIRTLATQQKILRLAKEHHREVWFDVHVWTEGPMPSSYLAGALSFNSALTQIADGASFKVVVFELNANNHAQRRAIANALAINANARDGRFPVTISANCLQPDGQNDNGWDQGLLFLNPSQTWIQPPGYVERMMSGHFAPVLVQSAVENSALDVCVTRSEDGHTLVLQVVNADNSPAAASIQLKNFTPKDATASLEVLTGDLGTGNTAENPTNVVPCTCQFKHGDGVIHYVFAPNSFSIITLRGNTTRGAKAAKAQELKPHPLTPVPTSQVVVGDGFWSPKLKLWREVTIDDCFTKFENDHGGTMNNFDLVRDGKTGKHAGPPWYDGLIYEMITGASGFLAQQRDPALEARLDGYIARIIAAQQKDGYVNTWTQTSAPQTHRWGMNGGDDRWQHDVYNAGAMIEAGVQYYKATGKTALLEAATRMANLMCETIGPAPKANVIPGHSLAEDALVNLYRFYRDNPQIKQRISVAVDEQRYLKLAEFFIDMRGHYEGRTGHDKTFGAYGQDHAPLAAQKALGGHAVRATLFCAGITSAAQEDGRADYLAASQRFWDSFALHKMYVTGAGGAIDGEEKFGPDYFLPNDGYMETCAAVSGGFFSENMNRLYGQARFVDVLERELYNAVPGGVSLTGNNYFYQNPLIGSGLRRWNWHDCPCCPPMFLKMMGALSSYIYAQETNAVYVNLFIGSRADLTLKGGKVKLQQTTRYPWDGSVQIAVDPEKSAKFDLFVRIPDWCQGTSSELYQVVGRPAAGAAKIKVNGRSVAKLEMVRGYARLNRHWKAGDKVEVCFDMPVRQVVANPKIEADRGQVALMRGPVIYCAESVDNTADLSHLTVASDVSFTPEFKSDLLGGVVVLHGQVGVQGKTEQTALTAIPFYASANREPCSMRVWLPAGSPAKN